MVRMVGTETVLNWSGGERSSSQVKCRNWIIIRAADIHMGSCVVEQSLSWLSPSCGSVWLGAFEQHRAAFSSKIYTFLWSFLRTCVCVSSPLLLRTDKCSAPPPSVWKYSCTTFRLSSAFEASFQRICGVYLVLFRWLVRPYVICWLVE